jgi:hypothetical protein
MAVEILGGRMEHDVSADGERALKERRGERVVYGVEKAASLSEVTDRGQVSEEHHRIGRGLAEHDSGSRCDRPFDWPDLAHVDEGELEPELGVHPRHQPHAAAVDVLPAHHVVPGLEQLEQRIERRQAGSEGEAMSRSFEARHVAFQSLAGRVLGSGVLVALMPAECLLDVGRCLVNRRHHCAGQRIGILAGMNGTGGKTEVGVLGARAGHRKRPADVGEA